MAVFQQNIVLKRGGRLDLVLGVSFADLCPQTLSYSSAFSREREGEWMKKCGRYPGTDLESKMPNCFHLSLG